MEQNESINFNETKKGMAIVIGNQPPIGDNTTIMLYMVNTTAIRQHTPTAYFSPDMPNVEVVNRLIGINTGIDHDKIAAGTLSKEDWKAMDEQLPLLTGAPLYIDDTPEIPLSDMKEKITSLATEKGVRLVVVNPVSKMTGDGQSFADEQERIDYITSELKTLADELNIIIFAVER